MSFEIAMVLIGVGAGAVAVLYAASRGRLSHARKGADSPTPQASAEGQVAATKPPAPDSPTTGAVHETVQPATSQVPTNLAARPGTTLGSPTSLRRTGRTYRRRAPPRRSTMLRTIQPTASTEAVESVQPNKTEE